MSFPDLRSFILHLEQTGQLVRIKEPVSSNQEITIIQHRVLAEAGPALLFENVTGSRYKLVSNLYGTRKRVEAVFPRPAAEIGGTLIELAEKLMPPSPSALWSERGNLARLFRARMKTVDSGPILSQQISPPRIDLMPCLTCWPDDGGPFFTLPLVHTTDPDNGVGNIGMYRLQRYDSASTGMHWQIEKGGGFHFKKAIAKNQPLPISVILGGPPALTIAAITPLPEGIDERILAALIMDQPLEVIARSGTGHKIPATAEFVLEGSVTPGDTRKEGPFGDHFGHYSHSAHFPVFRIDKMLARDDAIYPATVVGKPKQEDYFIGEVLQEMTMPLLHMIHPGITDLWSYPETGFHPLSVASVRERYRYESFKQACTILGEGQLSLTKILIIVHDDIDVKDIKAVSNAIWRYLNPATGLFLLTPTAQDTLDFTGPSMNTGSRLVLLATGNPVNRPDVLPPPTPSEIGRGVIKTKVYGKAFLLISIPQSTDKTELIEYLHHHQAAQSYLFVVLVSDDVDIDDPVMALWGWFTRFDPAQDIHPFGRRIENNRLIFDMPMVIDATWKEGYRKPVLFDPEIEANVDKKWDRYGIKL